MRKTLTAIIACIALNSQLWANCRIHISCQNQDERPQFFLCQSFGGEFVESYGSAQFEGEEQPFVIYPASVLHHEVIENDIAIINLGHKFQQSLPAPLFMARQPLGWGLKGITLVIENHDFDAALFQGRGSASLTLHQDYSEVIHEVSYENCWFYVP